MEKEIPQNDLIWRVVLVMLAVIALSVLIYIERDWIRSLGVLGYPGIFLVGLIASAAMFAPMPGLLVLGAAASVLNPFWAALLFAIGAAIGELSGYFAGIAGRGSDETLKMVRAYGNLDEEVRRGYDPRFGFHP